MGMFLNQILKIAFIFYRRIIFPLIHCIFQIRCRFEESCSHYTERMIIENGLLKGLWLGAIRFARCNPWTETVYNKEIR